jgi:hypothetical protein
VRLAGESREATYLSGVAVLGTPSGARWVGFSFLLREIWNEYVYWRKHVMPGLAEEEKLFHTEMNHMTVWVIEDAVAYTLMYPEDY